MQVTDRYRWKLAEEYHPNTSPIGSNLSSETNIPIPIRPPDLRNQILLDVPGIDDNRGIKHELVSMFTQRLIYQSTDEIKIILVVDEGSLLDNTKNEF